MRTCIIIIAEAINLKRFISAAQSLFAILTSDASQSFIQRT